MFGLFSSRETYRVHGPAHPESIKARALALRMERIRLQEYLLQLKQERAMSRTPAESHGPERGLSEGVAGRKTRGRRSGDDDKFMAGEPPSACAKAEAAPTLMGDHRASDDPATSLPAMEWRGDRVYFAGDTTGGYKTLAEALAAWRGRVA